MGSIDVSVLSSGVAEDWSIDPTQFAFTPRKLRVVSIGAGFSGLILAHKIKYEREFDFVDLTIYEKNAAVAGAWLENVYPGVGWYAASSRAFGFAFTDSCSKPTVMCLPVSNPCIS